MSIEQEQWFQFLDPDMKELVKTAHILLDIFTNDPSAVKVHDYSFLVFPMAKAYEGFLKKWLFAHKFIDELAYHSDHFRIGKSLNPSLPEKFKRDWYVYDKIVAESPDPHLADRLWKAWKEGRNLIFHYYPQHEQCLSIQSARDRIDLFAAAMADALNFV